MTIEPGAGPRIGVVIDLLSATPSSMAYSCSRFLAGLAARGVPTTLFRYGNADYRIPLPASATVQIPFGSILPSTLCKSWYFARAAVACDVVHEIVQMGFLFPVRSPFRKVITVNDILPLVAPYWARTRHTGIYRGILERSLRSADVIVAISRSTADDLVHFYPEIRHKMRVIYYGVSPPVRERVPAELPPLPPRFFLAVSAISPRKNLTAVIDAVARLREDYSDLGLVIVGAPGWGARPTMRKIQAGIAAGWLQYFPYLEGSALERLYRQAVGLLFPSFYEGFGLPIVEAMLAECPVVTTRWGATAEAAGAAAILIDPHHQEELAGAARRLLTEPALRETLVAAGREQAKQFTIEQMVTEHLELYRELAGKG